MNSQEAGPQAGATLGQPRGAHNSRTRAVVIPTIQMRELRAEKLK